MTTAATTNERQIRATESYADERSSYRRGKTYFVDSKRADFLVGHKLAVDVTAPAAGSQAPADGAPTNSAPTVATPATGTAAPRRASRG